MAQGRFLGEKVLRLMLPVHFAPRAQAAARAESLWIYDPKDPWNVEVRIEKSGVRWRVLRDSLVQAAVEALAEGDFQLGPAPGNLVYITNRDGEDGEIRVGKPELHDFLFQTRQLVPLGDERDYADFSRLLSPSDGGMELA